MRSRFSGTAWLQIRVFVSLCCIVWVPSAVACFSQPTPGGQSAETSMPRTTSVSGESGRQKNQNDSGSGQTAGSNLVEFPSAEAEFIVGPQTRWGSDPLVARYDKAAARQAKYWAGKFLASPVLVNSNHYDLPLSLYTLYYRTRDPEYRRLARAVADKWWRGPHINAGGPVGGGDIPGPLYTGTLGLTLYALDGHPEVFGFIDRVTREWMDIRLVAKLGAPDIYTDLREEGYILLSSVTLARTLPDTFTQITWDNNLNTTTATRTDGAARRARYLADSGRVAVGYFGRLQQPSGAWLWRAWNPEPALAKKIAQRKASGLDDRFEQPFMVGIYMEAAIALHRLTQDAALKASLQEQIVRHCEHMMRDTYVRDVTAGVSTIPRVLLYFFPKDFIFDPSASDRHLTTSIIHTFGYAYQLTDDPKYIRWGDELWDSCFANAPRDGFRSGFDEPYHLKLFTAEFRSSGRYLAWRQGALPAPAPPPESGMKLAEPASVMKPAEPASIRLVADALSTAMALPTADVSKESVEELVDRIKEAQRVFAAETKYFLSPGSVLEELKAALSNATTALAIAASGPDSVEAAKLRVEWTAARLKRAKERMKQ